jgi:ribonuclease HI
MMYVFTDGSCSHSDKLGAWASVVVTKARSKILYGVEYPTDIARCELLPILAGLRWLQKNIPQGYKLPVTVVSDSESTIRMLGTTVTDLPDAPTLHVRPTRK